MTRDEQEGQTPTDEAKAMTSLVKAEIDKLLFEFSKTARDNAAKILKTIAVMDECYDDSDHIAGLVFLACLKSEDISLNKNDETEVDIMMQTIA